MSYQFIKRAVDIAVSLMCLLLFAPLALPLMLVLRLTGEGEVFYFQRRIGHKNRYFRVIKFATMRKDSLKMGTRSITLQDDPRVTPVGKYLRFTKINELPQLINVLRGDMSLVGPRPFVDETFAAYPPAIRQRVYDIKPGLTGIGSLVFRHEEAMITSAKQRPHEFYQEVISPYKGQLELWYQRHQCISLDLKILFGTLLTVLFPSKTYVFESFPDLPRPEHPALRSWFGMPAISPGGADERALAA